MLLYRSSRVTWQLLTSLQANTVAEIPAHVQLHNKLFENKKFISVHVKYKSDEKSGILEVFEVNLKQK